MDRRQQLLKRRPQRRTACFHTLWANWSVGKVILSQLPLSSDMVLRSSISQDHFETSCIMLSHLRSNWTRTNLGYQSSPGWPSNQAARIVHSISRQKDGALGVTKHQGHQTTSAVKTSYPVKKQKSHHVPEELLLVVKVVPALVYIYRSKLLQCCVSVHSYVL